MILLSKLKSTFEFPLLKDGIIPTLTMFLLLNDGI